MPFPNSCPGRYNTPFPFFRYKQASRFAMLGDDKGLALTDQRKESAQGKRPANSPCVSQAGTH